MPGDLQAGVDQVARLGREVAADALQVGEVARSVGDVEPRRRPGGDPRGVGTRGPGAQALAGPPPPRATAELDLARGRAVLGEQGGRGAWDHLADEGRVARHVGQRLPRQQGRGPGLAAEQGHDGAGAGERLDGLLVDGDAGESEALVVERQFEVRPAEEGSLFGQRKFVHHDRDGARALLGERALQDQGTRRGQRERHQQRGHEGAAAAWRAMARPRAGRHVGFPASAWPFVNRSRTKPRRTPSAARLAPPSGTIRSA